MLLSTYKSARVSQEEIGGTLNILERKIDELGKEGSPMTPYYVGFQSCMNIFWKAIEDGKCIKYPKDLVKAFELMLEDL